MIKVNTLLRLKYPLNKSFDENGALTAYGTNAYQFGSLSIRKFDYRSTLPSKSMWLWLTFAAHWLR